MLVVVRQRGADGGAHGEEEDEPIIRVPRQKLGKLVDKIENMCINLIFVISLTRTHTTAHVALSLARMWQSMLLFHSHAHNSPSCSLARTQQPMLHSHAHSPCCSLTPTHTTLYVALSLASTQQPMLLIRTHTTVHVALIRTHTTLHVALSLARTQHSMLISLARTQQPCCSLARTQHSMLLSLARTQHSMLLSHSHAHNNLCCFTVSPAHAV